VTNTLELKSNTLFNNGNAQGSIKDKNGDANLIPPTQRDGSTTQ
jgi:hypothetical protein